MHVEKISTFQNIRKAFYLTDKEGPDKKVVNCSKFYQFFTLSALPGKDLAKGR